MVNLSEIKPGMPVVCSENGQFAVVDHTEGDASIKLRRDQAGQHHYIPVNWVTKVDGGPCIVDLKTTKSLDERLFSHNGG